MPETPKTGQIIIGRLFSEPMRVETAAQVSDEARDVWGVVYEIGEMEVGRLDKSEGFMPGRAQNSYTREERHVLANGDADGPVATWVYFARPEAHPPLPNAEYKALIVGGAKFWHLPADYIAELEKIKIAP